MEDGFERRKFDESYEDEKLLALGFSEDTKKTPYIKTLEGKMWITKGDYIITGIKGERYPCKADIFHATYELVED